MKLEISRPFWMAVLVELTAVHLALALYTHTARMLWLVVAALWGLNVLLTLSEWFRAWRRKRAVEVTVAEWWAQAKAFHAPDDE